MHSRISNVSSLIDLKWSQLNQYHQHTSLLIKSVSYSPEFHMSCTSDKCCGETESVECRPVMSLSLIVDSVVRWRSWSSGRRRVQHVVVMWVHCNVIVLASSAWLESLCQWGHVLAVVYCSAVECDDWGSQRQRRDLHCLLTSDKASWRQWM